ncbi:Protein kinase byr2 [Sphaceloma murrayae]|uniref:Protein kinase byr2 n=1 Tax=Sphaceloma murrayae TaxID=2082308 RepID=A0A2K1R1S0_9PEZI|nr:Protein kinase byr2 [Sphaceloma murrayae]
MGQCYSAGLEYEPPFNKEPDEDTWIKGFGHRIDEEGSSRMARLDDVVWDPLTTRTKLERRKIPRIRVSPPDRGVFGGDPGLVRRAKPNWRYVCFHSTHIYTFS